MTPDDPRSASRSEFDARSAGESLTGREVGEFVIRERIAEGAFGVIYRAQQKTLSREVVVKVLRWEGAEDDRITRLFLREARLASSLDHPYAAHVYAFGAEPDGLLWIAMELVRGTPLDVLLSTQGPLPLQRFEPLFKKLCEVVYTAHQQGMIHRDIKPSNVMIVSRAGELYPKLLDFGIAGVAKESKVAPGGASSPAEGKQVSAARVAHAIGSGPVQFSAGNIGEAMTPTALLAQEVESSSGFSDGGDSGGDGVVGSPQYMAPEQWISRSDTDARSDQYALGVLAYRVLTGRLPFPGTDPVTLAHAHLEKPVPSLGGKFPKELDKVFSRVMAKESAERYDDVLELAKALRSAAGLDIEPAPDSRLDERLRDKVLAKAPQPLADSVALLEMARNPQLAFQAALQVVRVAARLAGLLAVAAVCRMNSKDELLDDPVREGLRRLHQEELTTIEWLELTRILVRPFAEQPHSHPIPELVIRFSQPEGQIDQTNSSTQDVIDQLAAMGALGQHQPVAQDLDENANTALELLLPAISRLIEDLEFLNYYKLVARSGDRVEVRMGAQRASRAQAPQEYPELGEGDVALLGAFGEILVILSPFCQSMAPAPGTAEEIFLFDGPSRFGAKLVAFPVGFERHDGELWNWFSDHVFELHLDGEDDDGEESERNVRAPYMGLSAFSPDDADNYFGREREVEDCVNRLRIEPLLAVVGPSGAGKSSFVQAGIIPALSGSSDDWHTLTMRPGSSPLAELTSRLERAGFEPGDLRARLENDARVLGTILAEYAEASGKNVLLVVDQFEELLTLCLDPNERRLFATALVRAAPHRDNPVRVIITLRDDFLVRVQQIQVLKEKLGHSLQILGTPEPDDLERILCEPARRLGYEFEDPELPREMIGEVKAEPGALALLSFTASKLWGKRDRKRRVLPRAAYEALGGVGGALSQHAEDTLEAMTEEQLDLVREVFRQLVTAEGTRAILTRNELGQILGGVDRADEALEALIHERLLVTYEDENDEDRVEVVHEALLRSWPRLVEWQREDAESARIRDQLRATARQWVERSRPKGMLWRGDVLMEYRVWRKRYKGSLIDTEAEFAVACEREDARGRRIRNALLITAFAVLVVGLLVVLQLARTANDERARAEQSLHELFQEQGRLAWLADDPMQAFVYLAEAHRRGADNPALHFLLSRVSSAMNDQLLALDAHDGMVYAMQLSPDQSRLATGGEDGEAKIWDIRTGELRATLRGHSKRIWALRYSPDGSRIVTASYDKTAKVWNAETGALEWTASHEKLVLWADFAENGAELITSSTDGSIVAWDVLTGKQRRVVATHPTRGVSVGAMSPDGEFFLTGGNGDVRIWDRRTGEQLGIDEGYQGYVFAVDISANGDKAAVASMGGTVRILSLGQGETLETITTNGHTGSVWSVEFSPDGERVVTASEDRTAKVWKVATGELITSLSNREGGITDARFSPDGRRVATLGRDGKANLWDGWTGAHLWTFHGHADGLWTGAFDATGGTLITTGQDGSVRLWRAELADHEIVVPEQSHDIWHAVPSPDKTRIATVLQNGDIQIWSRDGELLKSLTGSKESSLALLRQLKGDEKAELGNYWPRLSWNPDGNRLLLSGGPRAIEWDVEHAMRLGEFGGHEARGLDGEISEVRTSDSRYTPDGSRIVTVGADNTARLWESGRTDPVFIFEGHEDPVMSADFNMSGSQLLTASYDKTVRLWDLSSGEALDVVSTQPQGLVSARFSEDDSLIILMGRDKSATVLTPDGEQVAVLEGHTAGISSALFTPDNQFAVTAGDDGTVKFWDVKVARILWSINTDGSAPARSVELVDNGTRVLIAGGKTAGIWPVTREERTLEQVSSFARCRVNYVLEGGSPKRIELDHQVCNERRAASLLRPLGTDSKD